MLSVTGPPVGCVILLTLDSGGAVLPEHCTVGCDKGTGLHRVVYCNYAVNVITQATPSIPTHDTSCVPASSPAERVGVGRRAEDVSGIAGVRPRGSCGLSGSQHPDQSSGLITRRMSACRSWGCLESFS